MEFQPINFFWINHKLGNLWIIRLLIPSKINHKKNKGQMFLNM